MAVKIFKYTGFVYVCWGAEGNIIIDLFIVPEDYCGKAFEHFVALDTY